MGISFFLERTTAPGGAPLVPEDLQGWGFRLLTVLTLTTGTAFVMWLGEQITERGIGNGISLIIFAGIVVGLPSAIVSTITDVKTGSLSVITIAILLVFMVGVVAAIVYMERAQRRIPIQYAKRVVGRRVYGGQSTYLPLRLNTGGVIPVIFAASIMSFPQTLGQMIDNRWLQKITEALAWGEPLYNLVYFLSIVFFCYFYTSIIFNPEDTAENMRKYGGFIPGIRPGKRTAEFIDRILTRITLVGALYLAMVAISRVPARRFQGRDHPVIGPTLDAILPRWSHPRSRHRVLLRRHLAAHRRRRGHGHGPADRVAVGHAPLRRIHARERIAGDGNDADLFQPQPGAAGSSGLGQGTQARLLAERYQLPHISSGDMLWGEVANGTGLGGEVRPTSVAESWFPIRS